jgi:tRNA G18 (ribose-2'-O)-methylase SpoU
MPSFSLIKIDSATDLRVASYLNLKDRELAERQGLFIVEGEHLVHRLLASDYQVESVLLSRQRAERFAASVMQAIPIYVAEDEMVSEIVGFDFHRGVLACGVRQPRRDVKEIIPACPSLSTLVICPEINDPENLGAVLRVSAGFGVDAVILGESCCDPLARRSIRVSMGAVFKLKIAYATDLMEDLKWLKKEKGVELIAAVVGMKAGPLTSSRRPKHLGLVFGNEAHGLAPKWLEVCDRRVTIPMRYDTDSLNVAVAAGIFLYHYSGREFWS